VSESGPAVSEPAGGWRDHSRPDIELRRKKAGKIISLVERRKQLAGARVLEIGTGAGVISAELAKSAGPDGDVHSIDTMDTRLDREGYEFRLTSGVKLPYDDGMFDVVVSNHVIEHVGTRADQQVHLDEIRRVLRPGGVGYLATPTRWALIEPHYKVPFLSWPPRRLRDRFVRAARAGKVYNVDPFGPRELERAIQRAGLSWDCATIEALGELGRIERPKGAVRVLLAAPPAAQRAVRPALPTMVYVLSARSPAG
jgi:2-polyprenyl-3-methyl-5-hydroxy-6-metoxy-1,4-benzoquinol methylase